MVAPLGCLEVPTSALARPSCFVAGDRIVMGARHYAGLDRLAPGATSALWAATPAAGGALGYFAAPRRPVLAHLSGCLAEGRPLGPLAPLAANLELLRAGGASAPAQLLLWTGPDAATGAGFSALASTEDMGWLTPVPAREVTTRATLATRGAWAGTLPAEALPGQKPGPLLLPFDLAARDLFAHNGGGVPLSWVGASAALEAEVSADSANLWAGGLTPDLREGLLARAPLAGAVRGVAAAARAARLPQAPGGAPSMALSSAPTGAPLCGSPYGESLGSPLGGAGREGQEGWGYQAAGGRRASPAFAVGRAGLGRGELHLPALGIAYAAVLGARAPISPSLPGLGLDEGRLVRSSAGRLADPALIAGKADPLVGPFTSLPVGPLSLLGLGWSATASLSTYPSFKMARGGLLRRPMSGLRGAPLPAQGLPGALEAPLLGKVGAPLGRPSLRLWAPLAVAGAGAGAPLEGALASWAATWAFTGPAPTEDLDPSFVNTVWTPETNTTRRSDHNSRYLVTWAPLAAALTQGGAFDASQSGPTARGGVAPLAVRTSLLALNEAGLKNTLGGAGVKASLGHLTTARPHLGAQVGAPDVAQWPALWAFSPSYGASPLGLWGQPRSASWRAGVAGSVLTARARAMAHGALSPALSDVSSGDSLTSLIASLDLVRMTGPDRSPLARQGYVPLSSSISASRRLRVTKGISLPSDTPMHIICGSKDVIHSWAIPGLGVKIDCIPGYNSHRRLLLRWRGAYWGQCMEVCGRYHHWMPIMVNVVHPALFADWCLTFLRGLDTQAHGGAVGPSPAALNALLSSFGPGR